MSSKIFIPTYLYIKQHTETGKLYFGKTINDPEKYLGSGSYWKKHINKHGKEHVVNLWYCLFYDEDECTKTALMLSEMYDIVNSNNWANVIIENGTNGFSCGKNNPVHKQILDGKCKLIGGDIQRKENKKRRENGTHHLLGGNVQRETHNKHKSNNTHFSQKESFKEKIRKTQKQLVDNGSHPLLNHKNNQKNLNRQIVQDILKMKYDLELMLGKSHTRKLLSFGKGWFLKKDVQPIYDYLATILMATPIRES